MQAWNSEGSHNQDRKGTSAGKSKRPSDSGKHALLNLASAKRNSTHQAGGSSGLLVRQELVQIDAGNAERQGIDQAEGMTIQALMGSQSDLQTRRKILAGSLFDG